MKKQSPNLHVYKYLYEHRTMKIEQLRCELKDLALDGLLVAHHDAYQNEHIAPHDARLAWLTHYTGSEGRCVVLMDHAALFVDGRYTLQARHEVDRSIYEVCNLSYSSMTAWIAKHTLQSGRIGYDPWLHTVHEIETMSSLLEQHNITLFPCPTNPIDRIWSDQPPPPSNPAVPYAQQWHGCSHEEKRHTIAQRLKQHYHVDCAILTRPDSIAWLLNIRGKDVQYTPVCLSFALLLSDSCVEWFVMPDKITPELQKHLGKGVTCKTLQELETTLEHIAEERQHVLMDPSSTPMWIASRLQGTGVTLHRHQDPCAVAKAVKNTLELQGIRQAHQRDGVAMTQFLYWITHQSHLDTITEQSAAQTLLTFRQQQANFCGPSFETISAVGDHSAIVHYCATQESDRPLSASSMYLLDSGGQYLDGTTDVTRTIALGLVSDEQKEHFTRVLKGHIALATTRFPPQTTGLRLDTLARRPLWEYGLDYDHGTGHGVGCYLNVHEDPVRISFRNAETPLQTGMVCSNEPGYYKANAYGIRIENLVTVVQCPEIPNMLSFETLTLVPLDRCLILKYLLNQDELFWLNTYHHKVYTSLQPLLPNHIAQWLKDVTAPL